MELQERVVLFQEMMGCCHHLSLWVYDASLHLISTNCPEEERHPFHNLLLTVVQPEVLRNAFSQDRMPAVISNSLDLMWTAVPYAEDGELCRIYVLGPCFLGDISLQHIMDRLQESRFSPAVVNQLHQLLRELPAISWSRILEYTVMLHNCVNREKISTSDLQYLQNRQEQNKEADYRSAKQDVHGTYAAEQEMVRMVREGDLGLTQFISRIAVTGNIGQVSNGDPLRQMKNLGIVCATLFSRAAIEGGLDAELSLSLTDRYIQDLESCRDITETSVVVGQMQEDFVRRVHAIRTGKLSRPVSACCDYIDLHLEEPITIASLAEVTHYAEYYLSKKFKKETGKSVAEYIREKRLERAAILLKNTRDDIQSICDRLQFGTHSYFTECFRKRFGVTPSQYREDLGSAEEKEQSK